jgi:diaminopimelate epimerase
MEPQQSTLASEDNMYGQYVVPGPDEMINLKVGQPSPTMLNMSIFGKHLINLSQVTDPMFLQYGDNKGYLAFRKVAAEFFTQHNLSVESTAVVDPEELLVTSGATNALEFAVNILGSDPEYEVVVFSDDPSYFLALNIFEHDFHLKVHTVPMTYEGLDCEYLTNEINAILKKNPDKKHRFILYTVPTFHNPTGMTMTHQNRLALGTLVEEVNSTQSEFIVLADEAYQMLHFTEEDHPPLPLCYYSASGTIISIFTFSKYFAPGIRLGFMQIKNEDLMKKFTGSSRRDSAGSVSTLAQGFYHSLMESGDLLKQIMFNRDFLRKRRDSLVYWLQHYLEEYLDVIEPKGGYFVWATLKEKFKHFDLNKIVELAPQFKVNVFHGNKFSHDNNTGNSIRMSFSWYSVIDFNPACERLKNVFTAYINLYHKTNIAMRGSTGRTGSWVPKLIASEKYCNMYNFIDCAGRKVDIATLRKHVDVLVDMSNIEALTDLLNTLLENHIKVPLVIGTTGDYPMDLISQYSENCPVAIIRNFSDGVPLFSDLIKNVPQFPNAKVTLKEVHHKTKKDAPSGTALKLQEAYDGFVEIKSERPDEDVIGVHDFTLDFPSETLTIHHQVTSRSVFGEGVFKYIDWIQTQNPGVYWSMKDPVIKYEKYNGAGNDFIIIDNDNLPPCVDIQRLVKQCQRRTHVGADGMIIVTVNKNFACEKDTTDEEYMEHVENNNHLRVRWTYYNQDGSCVEMCGNGLRCVGQWCVDHGLVNNADQFVVENRAYTSSGVVNTQSTITIDEHDTMWVSMPKHTTFKPVTTKLLQEIDDAVDGIETWLPSADKNEVSYVKVGVPHLVIKVDEIPSDPKFNTENMNCTVYKLTSDTDSGLDHVECDVMTQERGVGVTLACGTGCVAVAIDITNKHREKTSQNPIAYVTCKTPSGHDIIVCEGTSSEGNCRYISGHAEKSFVGEFDY